MKIKDIEGGRDELSQLREYCMLLERTIVNWNESCEQLCRDAREYGKCVAYTCRQMRCPDCPVHGTLDVEGWES